MDNQEVTNVIEATPAVAPVDAAPVTLNFHGDVSTKIVKGKEGAKEIKIMMLMDPTENTCNYLVNNMKEEGLVYRSSNGTLSLGSDTFHHNFIGDAESFNAMISFH